MIARDPKTGLWHRPDTTDLDAVADVRRYLRHLPVGPHDRVMDIGAHIGSFTVPAAATGAMVVAYEPEPENHTMLERNVADAGLVQVVDAAVVADHREWTTLYTTGTHNTLLHSVRPVRGRLGIPVRCVNFQAEMERVRPTYIKIDAEGVEHDLDLRVMSCVKKIAIEFDLGKSGQRNTASQQCGVLRDQGFEAVFSQRLDTKTWNAVWLWRRP